MRRRSLLWAASLLATACVAGCAMARWFASDEPLDIYFLRHGETTWNRAGILQGSIAYTDLTERGVRMAEETASGLAAAGIRFDRIYSSPYLRAFHTAEIIAGTNCPAPVADARLREMCFGKYEGVRYKDAWPDDNLRLFFEDPERYVPAGDGAESFRDVGSRLRDFLEDELVWQLVREQILPGIRVFLQQQIRRNKDAIIAGLDLPGHIRKSILDLDPEKVHDLVSDVSGEELGMIQLLGFMLGGIAGFILAFAQ